MNCVEAKKLIHAYLDGELDAAHNVEMEKHLRDCADCARIRQERQLLKSALNRSELQFKMPHGLRQRVVMELRQTITPPPRPAFWRLWLPVGATALVAALLLFFLLTVPTRSSSSYRLVGEITSSHVRSMMANHLMDVASTDQHTVKPWFDGKLDFAPPVKDLAAQGFPLAGGRLDYLDGHQVAALVYTRQKHVINLFIWPVAKAERTPDDAVTRNGYHLINWTGGGMTFWAVSDLNEKELRQFAREFRGN